MVSYIETGQMEKGLNLIETVDCSKNWQNKAKTEFFLRKILRSGCGPDTSNSSKDPDTSKVRHVGGTELHLLKIFLLLSLYLNQSNLCSRNSTLFKED